MKNDMPEIYAPVFDYYCFEYRMEVDGRPSELNKIESRLHKYQELLSLNRSCFSSVGQERLLASCRILYKTTKDTLKEI